MLLFKVLVTWQQRLVVELKNYFIKKWNFKKMKRLITPLFKKLLLVLVNILLNHILSETTVH